MGPIEDLVDVGGATELNCLPLIFPKRVNLETGTGRTASTVPTRFRTAAILIAQIFRNTRLRVETTRTSIQVKKKDGDKI